MNFLRNFYLSYSESSWYISLFFKFQNWPLVGPTFLSDFELKRVTRTLKSDFYCSETQLQKVSDHQQFFNIPFTYKRTVIFIVESTRLFIVYCVRTQQPQFLSFVFYFDILVYCFNFCFYLSSLWFYAAAYVKLMNFLRNFYLSYSERSWHISFFINLKQTNKKSLSPD